MIFLKTFNHGCLVINGDINIENDDIENKVTLFIGSKEHPIFQYKKTGASFNDKFVDVVYCNKPIDDSENEEDSLAIEQIKALEMWIFKQIEKYCADNSVYNNNVTVSGSIGVVNGSYEYSQGEVPAGNYFIDLSNYKGKLPIEYIG